MIKDTKLQGIIRISKPLLKKNNVTKAGIFGSYATGKAKKKSDVDFLIQFKGKRSLLDLVRLKHELEENLHLPVDVLTYKSIHPLLKKHILDEEIKVL